MYLENRLGGVRILSRMAQSDLLEAAHALLIENGVSGPVRWLHDGEDEWVFIVDTHAAANMDEERASWTEAPSWVALWAAHSGCYLPRRHRLSLLRPRQRPR